MKISDQENLANILIIDSDDEKVIEVRKFLSPFFAIFSAPDVKTALDTIKRDEIEISAILFAINTNDNTYFESLNQIQSDDLFKYVPLVLMCEESEQSLAIEALDKGAIDYITKPFNPNLVIRRIKNAVRLHKTCSALEFLKHDELTGLLTREAFLQKAEEFIDRESGKKYSILGIDIENFKTANSQYGEERCDEFLSYIASQLLLFVDNGIVGRFSGDQFVILMEMNSEISSDKLHQIRNSLLDSAPIPKQVVDIGIYEPIDTSLPVVRCCDRAFFAIRDIKGVYGKDISYYEDKLQQLLLDEQKIVECMETALKEEQFKVYYQPKHETITGKIAGAEALVRWIHPEYGFMSPGQFIPLFERNGFITKLDSYVMNKVCQDLLRWQKKGINVVPISVNISRRDFFEENWINSHLKLIDEYKLDHSLLHMEVTESMYSENMDFIIDQVKKVQSEGYMIEMDDFGAGYSSLGLLSTFPLNVIKLDISFVRHIDVNEIVIENIIKMAHRMGFITVAEGAESNEEYKILKKLGCDLIQGYFFSKPLPASEFEEYLKANTGVIEPVAAQLSISSNGETNDALLIAANEVAEGIPGGFFTYHADGNFEIIHFNQEILKIYECESSEEFRKFTGNSFNGMVHEEDLPSVLKTINEQIISNPLDYAEYRIRCKSGKIKYVRDCGRLVHTDRFGDVFYVFITDFTEEHNKLIEEKKINEVIQGISHTYSTILLIDFDTNQVSPYAISQYVRNTRSSFMNSSNTYEEFIALYVNQLVHEDDQNSMLEMASIDNVKNILKESNHFNFTFRLKSKLNGIGLVEMSFRKILDENSSNRAVITFRPIEKDEVHVESETNTSLVKEIEFYKRLEEEHKLDLKRAINKAETAEKSRKIFIENIVKALLDNMNEISGILNSTDNNVFDKDLLQDKIAKAKLAQEKMSFTINNIIKLTNAESGDIKINSVPSDMGQAIEKIKNLIQKSADEKNIKLETYCELISPYVYQDVTNTAEFVCEVLLNALKYTPDGGTVTFGLKQYPCENKDECIVEFKCKDTGVGISDKFLPHVFERFSREDTELNRKIPSSGNGLTIVKNIIDTMNGSIDIKSEPGTGTEITVRTKHRFANKSDIIKETLISSSIGN